MVSWGLYQLLLLFGWAFTMLLDWQAVIESKYPDLFAPPPQVPHSPDLVLVFMQ